jgi:hypothetical protein
VARGAHNQTKTTMQPRGHAINSNVLVVSQTSAGYTVHSQAFGLLLTLSQLPGAPLRATCETSSEAPHRAAPSNTVLETLLVDGLLGIAHTSHSYWLVVSALSVSVGLGIRRIEKFRVLPFPHNDPSHASHAQALQVAFGSGHYYFSDASSVLDVTQSVQARSSKQAIDPLAFVFNRSLLAAAQPSLPTQLPALFARQIIQGCVTCFQYKHVTLAVITRRAVRNSGTRFWARGLDAQGNAANFCETEVLMLHDRGEVWSYVLVRGSIPLKWAQPMNLKFAPAVLVSAQSDESEARFALHQAQLAQRYGPNLLDVDLVDSCGSSSSSRDQAVLGKQFASLAAKRQVPYLGWDFHLKCKRLPWAAPLDELAELCRSMAGDLGFYLQTRPDGPPLRAQQGVIRVNCMDCLDRTNVAQCVIALGPVSEQLQAWQVAVDDHFHVLWRRAWNKTADAVSLAYTGVPKALKQDFYCNSRRTLRGSLQDLFTSLTRYVQQNFFDGVRHDAVATLAASGTQPTSRFAMPAWYQRWPLAVVVCALAICYQASREHLAVASLSLGAFAWHAVARGLPASLSGWFVQRPNLL